MINLVFSRIEEKEKKILYDEHIRFVLVKGEFNQLCAKK